MSVILEFVMSNPAHPDCPKTLALIVQYLYETDSQFEKQMNMILFKENRSRRQPRNKARFTLQNLNKVHATLRGRRRPKKAAKKR